MKKWKKFSKRARNKSKVVETYVHPYPSMLDDNWDKKYELCRKEQLTPKELELDDKRIRSEKGYDKSNAYSDKTKKICKELLSLMKTKGSNKVRRHIIYNLEYRLNDKHDTFRSIAQEAVK